MKLAHWQKKSELIFKVNGSLRLKEDARTSL